MNIENARASVLLDDLELPKQKEARDSVLTRAFGILNVFVGRAGGASLSEVAARTGLPKPTALRLCGQLLELGALERRNDLYYPGSYLFALGSFHSVRQQLRELVQPFIADLYEVSHETVHLGVLDGSEVLYIDKFRGHKKSATTRVGYRKPVHCTALGKAIIAFSPVSDLQEVISKGFRQLTPFTIRSEQQLLSSIARIRAQKVAFDREEYELGLNCVAAPVFGNSGVAVAALSISGRTGSFVADKYAAAVQTAAMHLSRRIVEARLSIT